jgi:hypothetical protein
MGFVDMWVFSYFNVQLCGCVACVPIQISECEIVPYAKSIASEWVPLNAEEYYVITRDAYIGLLTLCIER